VVTVGLVALLIGSVVAPAAAFGQPQQVEVDPDSTSLTVDVQEDGDAQWEIAYRVRFDSDDEREAFENLSQDIENDSTPYTDRMETRMQSVADDAENATGRQMTVGNVTVETRTQVDYGLVVYRFEWTNFAAVDGDTITAGDAIDQFYLDGNRSLRVTWPEGYETQSVTPSATRTEERAVVWEGELAFSEGQPRVELVPEGTAPTTANAGTETTDGIGGDRGNASLPLLFGLVLGAMVVAGGVWLYTRREVGAGPPEGDGDDTGAGATGSEATAAGNGDADDGPPPELLSNEERLLRLLEQNGGRMKQKQVAGQLDWTAAKTSQVVSDLRDDDQLDSFRLGRENVLTLPDVGIEPGESGDES